jgi:hypothetical protein
MRHDFLSSPKQSPLAQSDCSLRHPRTAGCRQYIKLQ